MSEKCKKKKNKCKDKSENSLNSLLIVENNSGSLFIVEKQKKHRSLKKLLKKKRKEEKLQKSIPKPILEVKLVSIISNSNYLQFNKSNTYRIEIKDEPPDPDDELISFGSQNDIFIVDTVKEESKMNSEEIDYKNEDFDDDFTWQHDDDFLRDEKLEILQTEKKSKAITRKPRKKTPKEDLAIYEIKKDPEEIEAHKKQKLTGKKACKFCATIFSKQSELDDHKCEYLQCDSDKFICRICLKELSRNTFTGKGEIENFRIQQKREFNFLLNF